jgi:ribosome-binding factor A
VREVLAEALERLSDTDERLELVTVTSVSVDPDLRHCTVFISRDEDGVLEALGERRASLQAQIARETSFKRTPQLSFRVDPSLLSGLRIEGILRSIGESSVPQRRDSTDVIVEDLP